LCRLTRRQREILDFISAQNQRPGLRAELRGNRETVLVPLPGHGPRASDQPRAQGVHPARAQRKSAASRSSRRVARPGHRSAAAPALVAAGAPIEAGKRHGHDRVPDELIPRRGRSYVLKCTRSIDDRRAHQGRRLHRGPRAQPGPTTGRRWSRWCTARAPRSSGSIGNPVGGSGSSPPTHHDGARGQRTRRRGPGRGGRRHPEILVARRRRSRASRPLPAWTTSRAASRRRHTK